MPKCPVSSGPLRTELGSAGFIEPLTLRWRARRCLCSLAPLLRGEGWGEGLLSLSRNRSPGFLASLQSRPLPVNGRAIAYGIFQQVVPANAGTHTARTLASALEQRPFFTFEARGYGSLRSQGRPAERLYEATTDQRTAQFSHMRSPCACGAGSGWGCCRITDTGARGQIPPPAALDRAPYPKLLLR